MPRELEHLFLHLSVIFRSHRENVKVFRAPYVVFMSKFELSIPWLENGLIGWVSPPYSNSYQTAVGLVWS